MIKQVIVMRKDLNMRKGKMIAQGAHASMKILTDLILNIEDDLEIVIPSTDQKLKLLGCTLHPEDPLYKWLIGDFTKIVVGCNSEEELLELQKKADESNILNALITDLGKTEFNKVNTNTCLAIGPDKSDKIDSITGHLKLL